MNKPLAPLPPQGTKMRRFSETKLPTRHGELRCIVYRGQDGVEHVAMVAGAVRDHTDVLCRVHSECLTSEVLGSLKCDCKEQLDAALQRIVHEQRGVVIYLRQEGRGIGLGNKIAAYALQEMGLDTVDANRELGLPDDARDYSAAKTILDDLGVASVALMTNNPTKVHSLRDLGVDVERRVSHVMDVTGAAADYVRTKERRMGHLGEEAATVVPLHSRKKCSAG